MFMKEKVTNRKKYIIVIMILGALLFLCVFLTGCDNSQNTDSIFTVSYSAPERGRIEGERNQKIEYGKDAQEVTAIANDGFYFLQWSDGVKTATRQDLNIKESLYLKAEFALITDSVRITYKINVDPYAAILKFDGKNVTYNHYPITNDASQYVQRGTDGWLVEAEKLDSSSSKGLAFWQWSDGVKTTWRQDRNVTESFEVTALFGYTARYDTKGEGYLIGETEQTVLPGKHSQTVTAMPKKGYRFVEWSDGFKNATRQDKWVMTPIDVYAIFEWRDVDNFVYHYDFATDNYDEDSLTLARGEVDSATCAVPKRDYFTFDGWYLDEHLTNRASDANGNLLLGEEIFDSPSRDLYAKWVVEKEYVVSYKILMVYVTAVDGTFNGNDNSLVNVHYKMSEADKLQCLEITKKFKDTLNGMLDGLVNFEVYSYFTTASIDENCFNNEKKSIYLSANQIPELSNSGILDNYRSVMTLFTLGGNDNLIPSFSGIADIKYGCVPLDVEITRKGSLELAVSVEYYEGVIGACVHEFIHTIEQDIICYEYHKAHHPLISNETEDKLFLLNQWACNISDDIEFSNLKKVWGDYEKGGIPYSLWANQIFTVTIKADCYNGRPDGYGGEGTVDTGGGIRYYNPDDYDWWRNNSADRVMRIPKYSRTTWLMAEADPGYRFLYWSDGSTDVLRKITNVVEDITLTAHFERLSYTVEYKAGEGGRIEGETIQTALTGERLQSVTAVADEGYRFVGWSDNNPYNYEQHANRTDYIGVNLRNENGELYFRLGFTVTAIFERIEA